MRINSLAGFALAAVAHGFDGAGHLLFGGVGLFLGRGSGGHGGGGGADHAAHFLFVANRGLLDRGGAEGPEVVGGLEAGAPGVAIHVRHVLHVGRGQPEVYRLRLVDPFLAAGGGVHHPLGVDTKGGEVALLDVLGHAVDVLQLAVEVFEVVDHLLVPEAALLQVLHQEGVQYGELAREVGFDVDVFVERLDAGAGGRDVGDRGGGGDGEHVAVAHAVAGDLGADGGPIEFAAAGDLDGGAALVGEEVEGVLGEEAAIPLRAFIGGVGAALGREVGGGLVGVVGDGFHGLVVELDGGLGGEGDALQVEGVGETHDAEANGAVAEVGGLGRDGGVEVDVDDVVEGADGGANGVAQLLEVEGAVGAEVGLEDDGAQVTDGGLVVGRVEGDLGAEVGRVDDAAVVLGRAEVAGILKGDPGVAGLEEHGEHLFPELDGLDLLAEDFALLG